jgi:hypothetical protein
MPGAPLKLNQRHLFKTPMPTDGHDVKTTRKMSGLRFGSAPTAMPNTIERAGATA